MLKQEDLSFSSMKARINKAGNLLYQYRACNRNAATIWDIENIRHGVVYARTPLLMNDPYDSQIGFSTDKVYSELIDLVLNQIDPPLDNNLRVIFSSLLKYRVLGKTISFFKALNGLKKYISIQSTVAHVPRANLQQFVLENADRLYKKCPADVKKLFSRETFVAFSLLIKNYHNIEIDEELLLDILKADELLKNLEKKVITVRDSIYLPFIKDFLSKLTVTCFSASSWDNQLMWAHYANSYSGICVEYDFEKMCKYIGFVFPVEYSSERPTLSLADLGFEKIEVDDDGKWKTSETNMSAIISYLLTKNKCWEYEKEWRIINQGQEPNTPIFVDVPFVKSITLGLNLDEMCKYLIWDLCKEKQIECYQLVINQYDYLLTRERLTEESFPFDENKELAYINLLSEHIAALQEKITNSSKIAVASMENGDIEVDATINVLSSALDFLSDIYFVKASFNRCCKNMNPQAEEIAPDSQIGTSIIQMNDFIEQTKAAAEAIDKCMPKLLLSGRMTLTDYRKIHEVIKNILEMVSKHNDCPWYKINRPKQNSQLDCSKSAPL